MLYKLVYRIGMWKRNPSLYKYFKFLKESEHWTLTQLEEYQLLKAKEFLKFAYEYSDYYKVVFDDIGFNPSNLTDIEGMKKIPIIDKTVLLKHNSEIHTKYKFKKKFPSATSGTSGQGLKFYRNEEWDSYNRAAMFRGYSWYDVNPWDRNGYFWGYDIGGKNKIKTKIFDFLQNRFRIFSFNETEVRSFVMKLKKAVFIHGYSSLAYQTAKTINQLGLQRECNLKMVMGTSERIFDSYQDEIKKAFGCKLVSEYGAGESGAIAYECPECGNMHINMENVIVEEIDGEIVVTNLLSHSFPIIRYKLGDLVKLADKDFVCDCGRAHKTISELIGRTGKIIYGVENKYPHVTLYYVFKNLAIYGNLRMNYQAIQSEKGKVLIKIEQFTPEYLPKLETELKKYFKEDIKFDILFGQTLHSFDGKLEDFKPMKDEFN